MNNPPAKKISVKNISKYFKIGFQKNDGALSRLMSSLLGKESKKIITVLDSISFDLSTGENIGIIGDNGSGKSTLLRIIAGIYQPSRGSIEKNGDIIYMSGFGLGLKQRLTMRENIYLICSIMGLNRKETKAKFQEIVTFSELEEFIDTKVYQFSSGMLGRLCFSATIFCLEQKKIDIVLLDEVFDAGGDLNFQNKALKKMEELIKSGVAVIIVSHDLEIIKKYCNRVILLENGKIKKTGSPEIVINEYINSNLK
jgi:ABC-type polysaccharide/polyol phosphate transport system ATPase subunit